MPRIPTTKAVALKIVRDPKMSMATRLQACLVARPHITEARFARLLRMLVASGRRGPVIRECLRLLQEVETAMRRRGEADKVLAEVTQRMQLKHEEKQQ